MRQSILVLGEIATVGLTATDRPRANIYPKAIWSKSPPNLGQCQEPGGI